MCWTPCWVWVGLQPSQKQKQGSRGQGVPNNWPSALLTYPGLGNLPTSVSNLPCLPRELQLSPPPKDVCTGNNELKGGGVGMLGSASFPVFSGHRISQAKVGLHLRHQLD